MRELQDAVLGWYERHGRRHLPWRRSRDPYRIVVSEFMLQQTQVERVIPLYENFIARFDSFAALARAERAEVVRAWKGLGYNVRAVRLHELARAVIERHGGELPSDPDALRALPGIGPYTLAAVRAFAFELDEVAVDVNLRRIVHRVQLGLEYPPKASAREVDASAEALLPLGSAHAWNSALMDLGSTVCTSRAPACLVCPMQPWCAAAPLDAEALAAAARLHAKPKGPQSSLPFGQTRRFARGRILDRLRSADSGTSVSTGELSAMLANVAVRYPVDELLSGLERDGLVARDAAGVRLR